MEPKHSPQAAYCTIRANWPQTGDFMLLKTASMGFAQGPSATHGDGAPRKISAGSRCEVFDVDRTTGFITVHWDLEDSGAHEPFRVSAIVGREDLDPAQRPAPPEMQLPDPPDDLFTP
jgi:hypothetical protein